MVQRLARNLVDLLELVEEALVLSPASEVGRIAFDLVGAASELRRAAAWTALHLIVTAAIVHCSPGDQLQSPE